MRVFRAAAATLLVVTLIAGCGGGGPSAEVTGTINFEGKPIEQGSIAFIPEDGNSSSAGGAIVDGKYTAQKVATGMMKVRINGAQITGKKRMYDDPASPLVATSTEMLPPKYSGDKPELRYEVKAGKQTKDFDLTK